MKQTYVQYETGEKMLPHDLVPEIPATGPNQCCPYGYSWDSCDPLEEGWVTGRATIYKEGLSIRSIFRNGEQHSIIGKHITAEL